MNADMTRRVMRAIVEGSQSDLDSLAKKMIAAERKNGHTRLAEELERILSRESVSRKKRTTPSVGTGRGLEELPLSRRHGDLLATLVPRDALEHHMVLPPDVDRLFSRIESEYAARERLGAYGLRNRKTVLLYGPPGCGKSLGAKRIAWNTGLPLLKVRFDSLLSSYFGESASNLRRVFDTAAERPCVLLLDECDFIARSRLATKDVGEASRIVNSLLQLMEDYSAPGLLVATTNIESSLDEALFRRFDDVFLVPLPGPEEIGRLLKETVSAIRVQKNLSWRTLAERLVGMSAAAVVRVAEDAAKAAVLAGEKIISKTHFDQAVAESNCRATTESKGE